MDLYEKFVKLKHFTDKVGPIYGTEDFAIYLYSITKMFKPNVVVELGTGFGTTTLWSALALQENQKGKIYTVDDGSEWLELHKKIFFSKQTGLTMTDR
jgi:predicted O-methyltransferase YrrM